MKLSLLIGTTLAAFMNLSVQANNTHSSKTKPNSRLTSATVTNQSSEVMMVDEYSWLSRLAADTPPVASDSTHQIELSTQTAIRVTASDADGDYLTYHLVASPANGSLSGYGPVYQYTPAAGFLGIDSFEYVVSAGNQFSNRATVTLLVGDSASSNHAPQITSTPSLSVNESEYYQYQVVATDEDNDSLSFQLTSAPEGMTINENSGLIEWMPTGVDAGEHSVTVVVLDSQNGSDSQTFNLMVNDLPQAPVIVSEPIDYAYVGMDYEYQVEVQDFDINDYLTYELLKSPANMMIDSVSGLIRWTPSNSDLQTEAVVVLVSDSTGLTALQSYYLTLNVASSEPPSSYDSVYQVDAQSATSIRVRALDSQGNYLTYHIQQSPQYGSLSGYGPVYTYTPGPDFNGNDSFTFVVSAGSFISNTATVELKSVLNEAPHIISKPALEATIDSEYQYSMVVVDDSSPLSYQLISSPQNMLIDSHSGLVSWVADASQLGTHRVAVMVDDGLGKLSTQLFHLNVVEPEVLDDDNDGVLNEDDLCPGTPIGEAVSPQTGCTRNTDSDADGVNDIDDAFPLDAAASKDSDGDGYPDEWNEGHDQNTTTTGLMLDQFPLDAAASVDSDNDGYPESWNEGYDQSSSTTGLVLDVYPDSPCYLREHGDGLSCGYIEYYYNPVKTVSDDKTIYLLDTSRSTVHRWLIDESFYTNPIFVGLPGELHNISPATMVYSAAHNRLYLGYETGTITYIDLLGNLTEKYLASVSTEDVIDLVAAGNYLLVQSRVDETDWHHTFDKSGALVDSKNVGKIIWGHEWSEVNSKVYFYRFEPFYSGFTVETIDQSTGAILSNEIAGANALSYPLSVSFNGQYILDASGYVYTEKDLTQVNESYYYRHEFSKWLADGTFISVQNSSFNNINRYLPFIDYSLEEKAFTGSLEGVFGDVDKLVIVSYENREVNFIDYLPNNDFDGDGVVNTHDAFMLEPSASIDSDGDGYPDRWNDGYNEGQYSDITLDAFPFDPAASLDDDNDGYPDSWNEGHDESTSTTGLILDIFPDDPACYSTEHDRNGVCDYEEAIPDFIPDEVTSDGEIIYLLSKENRLIYRWSISEATYIKPLSVGIVKNTTKEFPLSISYSTAHNRLYLGYRSGEVHYINVAEDLVEQSFLEIEYDIVSLLSIGEILAIKEYYDFGYGDEIHVGTYTESGQYFGRSDSGLLDTGDYYLYDENYSRIYYFKDASGAYLNFNFQEVDFSSEMISHSVSIMDYRYFDYVPPISISSDGNFILLADGEVVETGRFTKISNLGTSIDHSQWINSLLVTVQNHQSTFSISFWETESYSSIGSNTFDGQVINLIKYENGLVLLKNINGDVKITNINFEDKDNDGMIGWWEWLYSLDDQNAADASEDFDNDGLINLAEFNALSSPVAQDTDSDGINDADEVNFYLSSPYLTDSDFDGLPDWDEINIFESLPNLFDSDGDGFSDYHEEIWAQSDANSIDSVPEHLMHTPGFYEIALVEVDPYEGPKLSPIVYQDKKKSTNWKIDLNESSQNDYSIRSGGAYGDEYSAIKTTLNVPDGYLQFSAKVDNWMIWNYCCNQLEVFVDGELQLTIDSGMEQYYNIPLSEGIHKIEWRYSQYSGMYIFGGAAWLKDKIYYVIPQSLPQ
ncbi:Ig-like domain-containing protein [Aliikangiella maris]|uniref:Ig-like domain-containing protein n=2 Tax=Aliikangiella maris TaxID=3162458 RepID=A0ABV3MK90_9GAMM